LKVKGLLRATTRDASGGNEASTGIRSPDRDSYNSNSTISKNSRHYVKRRPAISLAFE
jgi:hypothetical protein